MAALALASPGQNQAPGEPMEAFKLLFTTDVGLFSLGAILFTAIIGFYITRRFRKLMNEEPGKEGWN
jgi:hypothetical protein